MATVVIPSPSPRRVRIKRQRPDYIQMMLANALNSTLESEMQSDLLAQEQEGAMAMLRENLGFQRESLASDREIRNREIDAMLQQINKGFEAVRLQVDEQGRQRVADRQQSAEQHTLNMKHADTMLEEVRGSMQVQLEQAKAQGASAQAALLQVQGQLEMIKEQLRLSGEEAARNNRQNEANNLKTVGEAIGKNLVSGDEAFVKTTTEKGQYDKAYQDAMEEFGKKALGLQETWQDVQGRRAKYEDALPEMFDVTSDIIGAMRESSERGSSPNPARMNAARDTLSAILEGGVSFGGQEDEPWKGLRPMRRGFEVGEDEIPAVATGGLGGLALTPIADALDIGPDAVINQGVSRLLEGEVGAIDRALRAIPRAVEPNPQLEQAKANVAVQKAREQYINQGLNEINAARGRSVIPRAQGGLNLSPAQSQPPPQVGGFMGGMPLFAPPEQVGYNVNPNDVVAQMMAMRMGYV